VTGVGHGQANAVILPHAMAFNAAFAPEAMAGMARVARRSREDAIERVHALQTAIGVLTRLRDIGAREGLGDVARNVMGERGSTFNPREVRGLRRSPAARAAW
jgi:alcohol dehydrogenase